MQILLQYPAIFTQLFGITNHIVSPKTPLYNPEQKNSPYILKSEISKEGLDVEECYDKFIRLAPHAKQEHYEILYNSLNKINHNKVYNATHLLCSYYPKPFKNSIKDIIIKFYSKLLKLSINFYDGYKIFNILRATFIVTKCNDWVTVFRKLITTTLSKIPDV